MLIQHGPRIWLSEGPELTIAGFHYGTRMAAIRLSDGGLFIWSPTALTDALTVEIEALGPVQFLVAPNTLHHLHIQSWKDRWPEARICAPMALKKKRPDLQIEQSLEDMPPISWAADIDQTLIDGNLITKEAVFFHKESGTVLFTDLIQQHDPARYKGLRKLIAHLDLMTAPEPAVPRKFRVSFSRRAPLRSSLDRMKEWPAHSLVMAHGPVISDQEISALLSRAFSWL